MLEGKNPNRYFAIDLNPNYIGCSVLEKTKNSFKIIDTFCYDLTALNIKLEKSSDNELVKKQNNKRKFEIASIYKQIFNIMKHYNCAYFVMEDLNFKSNNEEHNKEFNRQTKNIWCKGLQENLISKYCDENGYILRKINPVYTSFIGNLTYNFYDPVNASIEIGRRGIFQFIKGTFYPELTGTILDTTSKRIENQSLRDVLNIKDCSSWVNLYNVLKETEFIYRWQLNDVSHRCFSMDTIKSKVKLYSF